MLGGVNLTHGTRETETLRERERERERDREDRGRGREWGGGGGGGRRKSSRVYGLLLVLFTVEPQLSPVCI